MAPRTPSGTGPSQRMLRVGELMRHALSDLLSRGDVYDPVLQAHIVTVPEVRMSPDLKIATAYIMALGGIDQKPVLEALERNKKFLRGELAHRVALKYAPDLRFRTDESFEIGAKMDRLLDDPKVKRDVGKPGDEA